MITTSTAATAGIPARPSLLEAAAKETAITISGNGHKRMAWCTLAPALAVTAICAHATAMAMSANRMVRSALPRASGASSNRQREGVKHQVVPRVAGK